MSVNYYARATQSDPSDTSASPNALVMRDNSAGIYGALVQGSSVQTTGNLLLKTSTQTTNFTAGAAHTYICDTTSGSITVTLPTASSNTDVEYVFFKKAAANTLTFTGVTGTGSLSSINTKVTIFCDGSTWFSA
jgi:hypothetical protein